MCRDFEIKWDEPNKTLNFASILAAGGLVTILPTRSVVLLATLTGAYDMFKFGGVASKLKRSFTLASTTCANILDFRPCLSL